MFIYVLVLFLFLKVCMILGSLFNLFLVYLFVKWGGNIYFIEALWKENKVINMKDFCEL